MKTYWIRSIVLGTICFMIQWGVFFAALPRTTVITTGAVPDRIISTKQVKAFSAVRYWSGKKQKYVRL